MDTLPNDGGDEDESGKDNASRAEYSMDDRSLDPMVCEDTDGGGDDLKEDANKKPASKEKCKNCLNILLSNVDGSDLLKRLYLPCCGALICYNCAEYVVNNQVNQVCPFCDNKYKIADKKIVALYHERVLAGDAKAFCIMADAHRLGLWGLSRNITDSIRLWEEAMTLGSSTAAYNLGVTYCRGEAGVPKDVKRALRHFTFAAKRGHDLAAIVLDSYHKSSNFVS